MAFKHTSGIGLCILITSAVAYGQRQSDTTQQHELAMNAVTSTYRPGPVAQRRLQTRTESDGRRIVVETFEGPDIDGRLATLEEVVTETTRGPNTTLTSQDVFDLTMDKRRRLAATNESRQDTQANGDTVTVSRRWSPDPNGRLYLTQLVKETRSVGSDVQRIDTSLLLPGINAKLEEAERTVYTERQISPEVARHEGTRSVRDVNGRWNPVEIRQGEVRKIGTLERVEEETVQRPDVNGHLAISEVTVTRSSSTKEQEQLVVERYEPITDVRGTNGRPPLSERVQRTTTATPNGGRYIVETVEARNLAAPNEPMRVVRRIETTISPSGAGQSVTQRRVFELDLNGRLVRIE